MERSPLFTPGCFQQLGGGGSVHTFDLFNVQCLSVTSTSPAPLSLRALIAGGGAPEIELAVRLAEYSRTLAGMEAYCVRAYGDALEVIPSTLAENAGLNPISTVTELRNKHAQGDKMAGINVRKVGSCVRYTDQP